MKRAVIFLVGVMVSIAAASFAASDGFPSRPRFQSAQVGNLFTSEIPRLTIQNTAASSGFGASQAATLRLQSAPFVATQPGTNIGAVEFATQTIGGSADSVYAKILAGSSIRQAGNEKSNLIFYTYEDGVFDIRATIGAGSSDKEILTKENLAENLPSNVITTDDIQISAGSFDPIVTGLNCSVLAQRGPIEYQKVGRSVTLSIPKHACPTLAANPGTAFVFSGLPSVLYPKEDICFSSAARGTQGAQVADVSILLTATGDIVLYTSVSPCFPTSGWATVGSRSIDYAIALTYLAQES